MSILPAFLLTLLLAHASQFLLPRTLHPRLTTIKPWLLQTLIIGSLFLIDLLLTQRPILSALLTLSGLAVFLVVNQAKFQALREPLVFSDVYLYIQVISHPRLFLPFLNIPLTIGAIAGGVTLLYLAIRLEAPAFHHNSSLLYIYAAGILLLSCSLLLIRTLALQIPFSLDPAHDIRQYGFYNSLLGYALQAGTTKNREQLQATISTQSPFIAKPIQESGPDRHESLVLPRTIRAFSPSPFAGEGLGWGDLHSKDNIIVIQSESFFDARRLYPQINPATLAHYDQIRAKSLNSGTLAVPSWGANTLRPEFAFLSGIDNNQLGYYRFNPYQYLQNAPTPTLAAYLKQQGYYCIAIHPNSSAFFKRDKVFPLFGFDEFIDIDAFDPNDTSGPYIGDQAVQQKITEIMMRYQGEKPLFIFAITMENHGPLHLESVSAQEAKRYYQSAPPEQHNDLSVYLRHLMNADRMLKDLTDHLQTQQQDTLLCFYGDHVPSMPQIYNELEFSDGRTDYLIWHNRRQNEQGNRDEQALRIEELPLTLLNLLNRDDG
ncbi:MAG: LTA synthase family protein [Thiolinea sp.]